MIVYTPIQRRIMHLLSDGKLHTKAELHKCILDDLSENTTVNMHITFLRKKLRLIGQTIICESYGQSSSGKKLIYFRLGKNVANSEQ